jgi:hypothetical protein
MGSGCRSKGWERFVFFIPCVLSAGVTFYTVVDTNRACNCHG